MSSFLRIASKVKPPPVKTTRVLFDAGNPAGSPDTFGRGILRALPHSHTCFTAADAAWASEAFNAGPSDAEYDRRADEAAMLDRYSSGWLAL